MPARIRREEEYRCRLSDKGKNGLRVMHPNRLGIAWSATQNPDYVRVVWDDNKEPVTYHHTLIERVDLSS